MEYSFTMRKYAWVRYVSALIEGYGVYQCKTSPRSGVWYRPCIGCSNEDCCRLSFEELYKIVWGDDSDKYDG